MQSQAELVCKVCECQKESCEGCTKKLECSSVDTCCCTNDHIVWHSNQVRRALSLEYLSLGWMTIEVVGSVIAGLIIGKSLALLAFAGDSVIELISAYAVLKYLTNLSNGRFSVSDSEKTQRVSLSLLILLVPVITLGAVYSYYSEIKPEASTLGIGVSLVAVIIMSYLWTEKRKIGKEANVVPLSIDSIESATCLFMAIAALGGLLAENFLRIGWADYLATGIILTFVILEIRESMREL
jgi:divalent metal cation (Fe/Co/Zn/Cd) transporter